MSQKEQEELRQLRCYRATRQEWAWDTKALASRQAAGNQDRWIANPFGVRTKQLGKRAKQLADEASRVGGIIFGVSATKANLNPHWKSIGVKRTFARLPSGIWTAS
jgi:hypothetical protein